MELSEVFARVSTQELIDELASRSEGHVILTLIIDQQIGTLLGDPIYQFKNLGSMDWANTQLRSLLLGEVLGIMERLQNGD